MMRVSSKMPRGEGNSSELQSAGGGKVYTIDSKAFARGLGGLESSLGPEEGDFNMRIES